jgi:hypothetical protein
MERNWPLVIINPTFGSNENYTLNLADLTNAIVGGKSVSLTKTVLTENQFWCKVIQVLQIGYLMYQCFIN